MLKTERERLLKSLVHELATREDEALHAAISDHAGRNCWRVDSAEVLGTPGTATLGSA